MKNGTIGQQILGQVFKTSYGVIYKQQSHLLFKSASHDKDNLLALPICNFITRKFIKVTKEDPWPFIPLANKVLFCFSIRLLSDKIPRNLCHGFSTLRVILTKMEVMTRHRLISQWL